ncbi:beta-ketoacyl-ACP reductase [Alicyclobacillus sacchari]|uniref:SDR family NAD(P)-dependent oxidoreductase n=1 Tax=Alicyclobacillus sacchari TaxID=392010 RepID=UPI0023EA152C|nr:3-oxoacyl-ACP reductase FabG [Alicyclobacillus sacchari]GMA58770.1 beta-ketoacyl-ACP reductase [Alicyclobacillus sacchari]
MNHQKPSEHCMRPLAGRTAIVTGASRGIGQAIAIALASKGANVAVHYHRQKSLAAATVDACRQFGVRATAIQADVTAETEVEHLMLASTQLGPPSILINNAGLADYGLAMEMSLERFQHIMAVNLTSVFLCTRAAIPYLRRHPHARVVNIASMHGISAAMEAAYAAAKGGVIAWTKSLAKELASLRITVNAIAPGAIDTDMLAQFDVEEKAAIVDATPLGRLGTAHDVAAAALFLADPAADFITGQVIGVNGGLLT